MLTIEHYCNKCEEWLTKSRSKGNGLMIFCGSRISDAFSIVVGYPTTSGPIRKKPTKLQFLKVKSDDNANFLGGIGGCHRILDSNVVVPQVNQLH
jgi:hypothetical protein